MMFSLLDVQAVQSVVRVTGAPENEVNSEEKEWEEEAPWRIPCGSADSSRSPRGKHRTPEITWPNLEGQRHQFRLDPEAHHKPPEISQ